MLLLFAAALLFVVFFRGRDNLRLSTFRSEFGWGYTISRNERVIVYQPYIPAIEGTKPFLTRSDARRTARIVASRIRKGVPPAIRENDLKKAGININGATGT